MLQNVVVLPVDTLNDGTTVVNETYTRYAEEANRSVYIGANHTLVAKDTLTVYRTPPKPTSAFNGVAKTTFKFSKDVAVTAPDGVSTVNAPLIVEVSFALPVGVTPAQSLLARQRALAMLDLDAVMAPLNDQLMI